MRKEKIAKKYLSPKVAGIIKSGISYPRYYMQLRNCRSKYDLYKGVYEQNVLFVAGLPKSGTTWLEKMLSCINGYSEIMLPEAVLYEQKHEGSHNFDMPQNTFKRLKNSLAVLKLHSHGSLANVSLLEKEKVRYVVLFRDLRDVALSHCFYVQKTPYHPEYKYYSKLSIEEGLKRFYETLLPEFIEWVNSWYRQKDSDLCLVIKYEDLRENTLTLFKEILNHYKVNLTEKEIQYIVNTNSFSELKKKEVNSGDEDGFFRKGVSGDWKNYFSDDLTELYNDKLKEFNQKFNY